MSVVLNGLCKLMSVMNTLCRFWQFTLAFMNDIHMFISIVMNCLCRFMSVARNLSLLVVMNDLFMLMSVVLKCLCMSNATYLHRPFITTDINLHKHLLRLIPNVSKSFEIKQHQLTKVALLKADAC